MLAALVVLFGLERLFEGALLRFGSRPLGMLWNSVSDQLNGLPQLEAWAVLVALFGWLGLRTLGGRLPRTGDPRPTFNHSSGSLRGWLDHLDDQSRGPYFRWRLARRAAALADELELPAPIANSRLRYFLEAGRKLRTVRPDWSERELKLDPWTLIEYLEQPDSQTRLKRS